MEINNSLVIAVIEQAGVPALRVGFTLAVIVFLLAGVIIFRRDTNSLLAIQMLRMTSRSSGTIARRRFYLSGADSLWSCSASSTKSGARDVESCKF
jgi:hypothetical protein